ncbi:MAG: Serine/threonine-protein kinase StkP [Planctomycetota bacterium]|jgi:serine/threonine-protein kinase
MIAQSVTTMKRRVDSTVLRNRQRVGKYRIERRLAQGGFAYVYQAMDTIEGIRVALKMPHASNVSPMMLNTFQREARLVARLDHPNILPLKDASFIDGRFIIASKLGEKTLCDRLKKRMSVETALEFAEQMIQAVAYAHRMKIIHCDIKPENMILLEDGRLQLTDFGIAKIAQRTIHGSGSGTVGYMAPEQAMGRPSMKSDVFSIGLIMCKMLTGHLPEWPFDWPVPGHRALKRKAHPELVELLRRTLEVRPNRRFRDANELLAAFRRVKPKALRHARARRRPI